MATPAEKVARSLEQMNAVQRDGIVRSRQLTRTHLGRLTAAGFLQEILQGWYLVTNPVNGHGATVWYTHYWPFLQQYLNERFRDDYCLNPEASLRLLTGATVIPRQLIVLCRKPNTQVVNLPLGTSLLIYHEPAHKIPQNTELREGLRVMNIAESLLRVPEGFYQKTREDAVIALQIVRDITPLLSALLDQGNTTVAGRLAGAFRHTGNTAAADRILRSMKSAGHQVREQNPFLSPMSAPTSARILSPYVARLQGIWASMRGDVEACFPAAPGRPADPVDFLAHLDEQYVQDAYHSLSIEGYRVSPELIEKIRRGDWNPDASTNDSGSRDALAARGYLEAFQAVRRSLEQILSLPIVATARGESAEDGGRSSQVAAILRADHQDWYQALFAPSVRSGLLPASTLAGYRSNPVFIHSSRHIPLPAHSLVDAVEALFDLIASENNPAVQAVLGHFLFVCIHPYTDCNGRMARFLMNALFAGGGFPWTILHLENRTAYMAALESASVEGDIQPFARYVREETDRAAHG